MIKFSPDSSVTVHFVSQGGVEFLVTLFVLCVDVMSGYTSFAPVTEASRALRFPQAVASLIRTYGDANSVRFDTYCLDLVIQITKKLCAPFHLVSLT